jgi:hypothetical protein
METEAVTKNPNEYSAHSELLKAQIPPSEPTPAIMPVDDERLLLRPYDKWDIVTELRSWMTFLYKDRQEKIKRITSMTYDHDKKVNKEKRQRYLLWVIFKEVLHPDGNYEVADSALMAIFNKRPRRQ